jgi:predicted ATPase
LKIEKIRFSNFGPFLREHTLELEPDVTVLTGANDTGKSFLMKLIWIACSANIADRPDVNTIRAAEEEGGPADRQMKVTIEAKISSAESLPFLPGPPTEKLEQGDGLIMEKQLSSRQLQIIKCRDKPVSVPTNPWTVTRLPPMPASEFRDAVPIGQANDSEAALLRSALGANYANLPSRTDQNWPATLRAKEDAVRDWLNDLLPSMLRYDVHITTDANNHIRVSLKDSFGIGVPLHSRGHGIRQIFSLLGPLVESRVQKKPQIILLDEPEHHLHADAQHTLRQFLERIGREPLIQVIYATHSSSMINNMREQSIRVLSRKKNGNDPTSVIDKLDGSNHNFGLVRTSLGLAPSDSLLYADTTIIVEGKTEVRCLPSLLERLEKEKIPGFENAGTLLAGAHFLDGEGDSFEFIARFAKSHGCYVIVFLDGDKKQRKGLKKIESSEDIPVIRLKPNKDFESLIAPSTYFAAIQKLAREADAPVNADELTQQKFDEWLKSQKQSVREAVFGRQIHEWLDANECRLSKYAIMHEAVNLCDIGEVHVDELRSLVGEMRRAANEGARPGV